MSLKPRYKRRILWSCIIAIGVIAIAVVLVPPMITLNNMRPRLEQAIATQTGVTAQIRGDIHFSLLGRATIVAHDVYIPNGQIGALMFSVPLTSIFNLDSAQLNGDISIYDAQITISNLIPQNIPHVIDIHNSTISFKDKTFDILDATLSGNHLIGTIRTPQHKYDIDFHGDEFFIHNQNDKLQVSGQLFSDGSARGKIAMETNDINRWFGFSYPRIEQTVNIKMNFAWDGNRGWTFTDIKMPRITGNIEIHPNDAKIVQLHGHDITYDLSFLTQPSRIYYMTSFDLDFTGNLKFANHEFHHLQIRANGTRDKLQIQNVTADNLLINGGTIDANGAHDVIITTKYNEMPVTCVFSGTPSDWQCSRFSYGTLNGTISVTPDNFYINVKSDSSMPNIDNIISKISKLAPRGRIDFEFSNIAGTYSINNGKITPTYKFANNKTLEWVIPDTLKIPKFMQNVIGNFRWHDNMMQFVPHSKRWILSLSDNYFNISGQNIKDWFPNIDMRAFANVGYSISGTYHNDTVSGLKINIAGHEFNGTLSGNRITLHTDVLNLDSFISQEYLDNYEELTFLSASPITIPFNFNTNVSLSADALIYNGNIFKNFVYALKRDAQTFSITDSNRGNMLATITRNGNKYEIFAQLNRFVTNGLLLSRNMPLNVRDTMITAEINMNTFGNIAHDMEYNMTGNMDLSFDGGYLVGIGIDDFFASADQINTFNAEYALSYAFDGGESAIKKMRIIGEYKNGNFITTTPIQLQLRHTDATGEMEISDGRMYADLNMTLRGTSPVPVPVELRINPDGTRSYSLSEIMINFDPTYMRDFVRSHDKF